MASKLKRVSAATETAITDLANREGRTFVSQLDRVVDAGMKALGETVPDRSTDDDTPTPQPTPKAATKPASTPRQPATAGKP